MKALSALRQIRHGTAQGEGSPLEKEVTIDIGVIVEKTKIDHPWQEWRWVPAGVFTNPPAGIKPQDTGWIELVKTADGMRYHAGTLPLTLHRKETEAYLANLVTDRPKVFVVMRDEDDVEADFPLYACLVTVSAYEAQDYMDSGEELVEAVDMPDDLRAFVDHFTGHHHVNEEFKKRRRDRINVEDEKFGKEPIFLRDRAQRENLGEG